MEMKIAWVFIAMLLMAIIAVVAARMHAGEKPVTAGNTAPDFTLNSQEGKPVSLHDFKGRWVVLYFYPKDFTSGCTVEAHNFQRDLAEFESRNAVILGVSVQDENSHEKFCTKEGLHFKLLADTKKNVSSAYGSVMPLIGLSKRHTFLIDPQGVVRKVYLDVNPGKHSQEVLADLDQLQKSATGNR
jgi:thioredoxin-dependent peroxiredoxin